MNYNINDEPMFAYTVDPNGTPDPNNYHLAAYSFCKEKGNPSFSGSSFDYDGEARVMGTYVDIGADEVNPECDDVSNELDWDADGLVNFEEFSKFQRAWLSYDPNHPLCDPNHPNYVNDPNAPGYISETDKERYDHRCDLIEDLCVDLADLAKFIENGYWLWKACWLTDETFETMAMSGGGESMLMALPMAETFSLESALAELVEVEDPYAAMSTTEVVSLVSGIYEIMDNVETSIAEDHENAGNLLDIKDFLEDVLADIKASRE